MNKIIPAALAAALAAAAATSAFAAPPPDVLAWAKEQGVKTDRLIYLGSTEYAAYFAEQDIRTPPGKAAEVSIFVEYFQPTAGPGSEVLSGAGNLQFSCANFEAKIDDARLFERHGADGKSSVAGVGIFAALAGADMEPIRRGSLLIPSRRDLCRATIAQRKEETKDAVAEAKSKAKMEVQRAKMRGPNTANSPMRAPRTRSRG